MRNFEERKAEIFRRSENRIIERKKKRRRIIALCVPLCLCVAVLLTVYLPDLMISSEKNNFAEDTAGTTLDGATGFEYFMLEINDSNTTEKTYDGTKIKEIYGVIQSSFTAEGEITADDAEDFDLYSDIQKGDSATKGENNGGSYPTVTTDQSDTGEQIYIITFVSENTRQAYILKGNTLTDKATKKEVLLTDGELSALINALENGISKEESE